MKTRHFRRPSAWTSFQHRWTASRWTIRLSYVTREGIRDILREIVLAAWKSFLRRAPSASGLCARAVAVVCWQVPLKKAAKDCFALFLLPPRHIRLVKRVSRDIVVETELAVKVSRHQNILVFLTWKTPYSIEGLWIPIDPASKVVRTYTVSWAF